jgi:hypothetical protein
MPNFPPPLVRQNATYYQYRSPAALNKGLRSAVTAPVSYAHYGKTGQMTRPSAPTPAPFAPPPLKHSNSLTRKGRKSTRKSRKARKMSRRQRK